MSDHVTPEMVRELFQYEDGALYWRNPRGRMSRGPLGSKSGDKRKPGGQRLQVQVKAPDGRRSAVYIHRAVWAWHHGHWPTKHIDHINGDVNDNRIENLRDVTSGENSQNRRVRGVTLESRKVERPWRARIMVNGRSINLGYFDTEQEALDEYQRAKLVYHDAWATGQAKVA